MNEIIADLELAKEDVESLDALCEDLLMDDDDSTSIPGVATRKLYKFSHHGKGVIVEGDFELINNMYKGRFTVTYVKKNDGFLLELQEKAPYMRNKFIVADTLKKD